METNGKMSRCEQGSNEKSSDLMRLVDANLTPPGAPQGQTCAQREIRWWWWLWWWCSKCQLFYLLIVEIPHFTTCLIPNFGWMVGAIIMISFTMFPEFNPGTDNMYVSCVWQLSSRVERFFFIVKNHQLIWVDVIYLILFCFPHNKLLGK